MFFSQSFFFTHIALYILSLGTPNVWMRLIYLYICRFLEYELINSGDWTKEALPLYWLTKSENAFGFATAIIILLFEYDIKLFNKLLRRM